MARTAHHLPLSRAGTGGAAGDHRPWRSVRLYDLRYSARALAGAGRASRRPVPEPVRRSVDVHSWARADTHDRYVSTRAAIDERRDRQRLRARLTALRRLVDAPGTGVLVLDAADSVDVPPARHRHGARWLA
ncbi:hypothetical protein OG705_09405 [Streptomyces sp. NBC_00838]|uniref:hypothetical protein n=1 Tax=Streptomyces sp. NBC_00838 TaxID=2903680 RepID=UPI0038649694|nr:hypothetical protein OG705_09405 [Streptomyces sp. NBC_00838]